MAGSTLFDGIKFWLSRKIPMYSTFAEDIRKHGGEIVPLERLAHMLIVDHLRKDNHPPDRFIELSIKNGILEDISDHRVQTQAASTRPVGSFNQNIRSTRIPFTSQDDAFLVEFLSKTNLALQGDKAFHELERQNNRHTWQSWRSRWVKRLQHCTTLPPPPKSSDPSIETELAQPTSNGRPSNLGIKRDAPNDGTQSDNLRSLVQQREARGKPEVFTAQQSTQRLDQPQRVPAQTNPASTANREQPSGYNSSAPKTVNGKSSSHGRDRAFPSTQPQVTSSISTPKQDVVNDTPIVQKGTKTPTRPLAGSLQDKQNAETSKPQISHTMRNDEITADKLKHTISTPSQPLTETRMNESGVGFDGSDEVSYPQIVVTDDEGEMKKPAPASVRELKPHSSKELDIFELDENLAGDIWRELLLQAAGSNSEVSEETVILTANAGIIRALRNEDFQAAWNMWWHTNPERTEDEWVAHFNQFCIPFYRAHEKEFEALYRQRLADLEENSGGHRVTSRSVTFARGSPELGNQEMPHAANDNSKTAVLYRTRQLGSPELGDDIDDVPNIQTILQSEAHTQQYETMRRSARVTPPRKRSRSFSEVPESPQAPRDSDSVVSSKRHRLEEHDEGNPARPSSSRAPQQRLARDIPLKYQHGNKPASDRLDDTGVQASIDRQLLLEVEEAKEIEESIDHLNYAPLTAITARKNPQTTTVEYKDSKAKAVRLPSGERPQEESLFMSQASRSPSPAEPRISKTQGPIVSPIADGPFYEGSEAGAEDDFEDLTSQMADGLRSSLFSRLTTPREAEDHNQMSRTASRSNIAEDTTDLERESESVDEWIERQLQEGHSEDVVMLVLHASMMDVGLARKALLYHRKFHRLPNTKAGIWTEEDDSMLLKHSRKGKRDLIEKHGREALDKRREYLVTFNSAP